ncbi:3'-5' exoribonuclease HELZ2-like isoform X1 [Ambystoma mexicanum]|uniref:3'-5' exoribonuclease HELZ2-like isoform X1 n=1 Tax=Ambystoma mexicanum TaxID=8296 RepID=UPI0037E88A5B
MAQGNGLGALDRLHRQLELRLACAVCIVRQNESTFVLRPWNHNCSALTLLGRLKGSGTAQWHEIRHKPDFPIPVKYVVCWYYRLGFGCERHRNRCTFAWSQEEALVWTVERDMNLHRNDLRARLLHPQSNTVRVTSPTKSILTNRSDILQEYGGQFQEICETCFYCTPPRISPWPLNSLCRSHRVAEPLLVHIMTEEDRKTHYKEIRPVPAIRPLQPCQFILRGLPCKHGAKRCNYAHSEVEMMVWEAERLGKLLHSDLLTPPLANGLAAEVEMPVEEVFYCRVCLVTATSQEQFERHCASLEHTQMMSDDTLTVWKYRSPPCGKASFTLCERPETCVYGEGCTGAHSSEELQEWIQRAKVIRKIKRSAEKEGLLSYSDRLIQEYRACSSELLVMAEQIQGVSVSCNQPETIRSREKKLKHNWKFTVQSSRPLMHVALLKRDPGVVFSLAGCRLHQRCTYASGSSFYESVSATHCCVTVQVECSLFGTHEQWLVLDFGTRPVLLKKILLIVGSEDVGPSNRDPIMDTPIGTEERWHSGNRLIIPCFERTLEEVDLLAKYKPPTLSLDYRWGVRVSEMPITRQNYRERMHKLLFAEEMAVEGLVSRLRLVSCIIVTKMMETPFGMKFAAHGERFAEVPVTYSLTPDTDEGYLLKRSVRTALLSLSTSTNKRVYEVLLEHEATTDRSLWVQIPPRCCHELDLKENTPYTVELQFQTDRQQFSSWHQAVDLLLDEKQILPDLVSCSVPVCLETSMSGNEKQKQAISFITGCAVGTRPVPPLVIYGPFGTGKTYMLAKAAMVVLKDLGSRVLICTHTNSAADLYVREHFHPYVIQGHPEAVPLRVMYIKRSIHTTNAITLKYCHLSENQKSFMNPPISVLKKYRVVITTTANSQHLRVPRGFFSHILIDEAAQMLECEALIPLAHADHQTRIVLAGDHMQLTHKLFCLGDGQLAEYTLLNRLFQHYQQEQHEVARKSRIIFHQNYRCTPAIIQFVSKHFYIGDGNAIEACGAIPPHPSNHPLMFCHTHGVCEPDGSRMSWMNTAEIMQVTEKVLEMQQNWPDEWGPMNRSRICVLSHGMQVKAIRQELRKVRLGDVTVESYESIPGREFRVVIISTVHTRESIVNSSSSSPNLEFFNEARVLNTAMTRAQSQVIVVGDAVALCSFGKCSKIWKHYIQECVEHDCAYPENFTVEQIKQAIADLAVWRTGPDEEDDDRSSDTDSWTSDFDVNSDDPILQELLDSSRDARVTVTQEGFLNVETGEQRSKVEDGYYTSFPSCTLKNYLQMQPKLYKRCELVKEFFDKAYALSLDESPPLHITIQGRVNCGMAFSGDEVVVQILSNMAGTLTQDLCGKVIGVLEKAQSQQIFVCNMDPHDPRVMVPINQSVTKIFAPGFKDKPNVVPIRTFKNQCIQTVRTERITEEIKRTRLFVVQIICWREGFYYPLGIVTNILPLAVTAEQGFKILDIEYELDKSTKYPPAVTKEVTKMKSGKSCPSVECLKDCRSFLTFTIDPDGAQDLDDAITVRDLGCHYEVGVHIADVASFVPKDGALDEQAKQRGTTYYAPGRDPLHMFPPELSQDLLCLLPEKDRRVISLFVVTEKDTDLVVRGTFAFSLINSDRQLSYEEAENLIQDSRPGPLRFDTVEDCLSVLYHFSTVHRKCRLQDDCFYDQLDEECSPGNRRAHHMIAELMIMFNNFVAEFLTSNNQTKDVMPLRCQGAPNLQRAIQLKNKHEHLIPLSIHLSHHLNYHPTEEASASNGKFVMLTPVWEVLQSAARSEDFNKMIDLLMTDDLHPNLAHICWEFRKLLSRASFNRSNSTEQSKAGHYSLQLDCYTWASSPIRRYIDIVVQRHLHSTLCKKPPEYLPEEIDFLCHDFGRKNRKAKAYEKRAYSLQLATQLQSQVQQKLAFVMTVESNCFGMMFPLNHDTLPNCIKLKYSRLQLTKQPAFNPVKGCTGLAWRRRTYSVDPQKQLGFRSALIHDDLTSFSLPVWEEVLKAVRHEKFEDVVPLLNHGCQQLTAVGKVERSRCSHYMEVSLELYPGSMVTVQLTSSVFRGFLTPSVQLWTAAPGFNVCVEHSEKPIECFTEYATLSPKPSYRDPLEYRRVWQPLCAMESATSAVQENANLVLHDLCINWTQKQQPLLGSFSLSKDLLQERCIKVDFEHCYLCIRLGDLHLRNPQNPSAKENLCQKLSGENGKLEVDPATYTWVAHGLTDPSEEKLLSESPLRKVDFHLHQVSMTTVPSQVFADSSRFTVEIIPQLLPDVRKEIAVEGLQWASKLTKCIAVGQQPPETGSSRNSKILKQNTFDVFSNYRRLNASQNKAIATALRDPFTLIQGPPGTGKTLVGVHLVHWFHRINLEQEQQQVPVPLDPADDRAKSCILYCGPSNKSVDVVAAMLLPMRGVLRPLRVYGEQMEVVDYPYPGSSMHLNFKSLHDGKPKQELRSITLHHRIRMSSNEYHSEILEFDARIRSQEELSEKDIKEYKSLLKKARELELRHHDVILCTCCAASHDYLKKLPTKQILIDECGMCTEPETLIPLVSHKKAEQVVLLGDHKQLRPVVLDDFCRRLGMERSLFERYGNQALMLDIQYRMHMDICSFPSGEFYEGRLKTWSQLIRPQSVFYHARKACCPIIFGHVEGKEQSLFVSTREGNENSKANAEEAAHAVQIVKQLTLDRSILPKDIAILTPYNAQVGEINQCLQKEGLHGINVCTIMKSQGSEWRYVVLSTVRSCSQYEADRKPTKSWLNKNLGSVTDQNQINVAITRAQEGLCILGNRHLLLCCFMWKRLLEHYRQRNASVLAHEIQVRRKS